MTAAPEPTTPVSVVTGLYLGTKALHLQAERTGIIRDMLRGAANREAYVMLMRNLHPAYQALESGLKAHRDTPTLRALAAYDLDRTSAIVADLVALSGPDWAEDIALLPEAEAYAARINDAAHGDSDLLIAHAYTRYLGDLSGGQILRRLLAKSLALTDAQLSFYDFPRFDDLAALKSDYRNALEDAGTRVADPDAVIAEGNVAFTHNIAVSCAIKAILSPDAIVDAAE
jgi:heme oxygenase